MKINLISALAAAVAVSTCGPAQQDGMAVFCTRDNLSSGVKSFRFDVKQLKVVSSDTVFSIGKIYHGDVAGFVTPLPLMAARKASFHDNKPLVWFREGYRFEATIKGPLEFISARPEPPRAFADVSRQTDVVVKLDAGVVSIKDSHVVDGKEYSSTYTACSGKLDLFGLSQVR